MITRVEPIYPALAAWEGVSGVVTVHVLINQDGDVIDANALSGHALLRNAAATAVRDWKFKPAESKGKPVKVDGTLTVSLSNNYMPPSGTTFQILLCTSLSGTFAVTNLDPSLQTPPTYDPTDVTIQAS